MWKKASSPGAIRSATTEGPPRLHGAHRGDREARARAMPEFASLRMPAAGPSVSVSSTVVARTAWAHQAGRPNLTPVAPDPASHSMNGPSKSRRCVPSNDQTRVATSRRKARS